MSLEEAKKWLEKGVVIVDHNTTYIDENVMIGDGTTIYPNVTIRGLSSIGENNVIDSNTIIIDSQIGNDNGILSSYIKDAIIGNNNSIGPFCHIREKSKIENDNQIGNFVEIKNSVIGNHNSFKHLSYTGDSDIGNDVNFSAGAIIANYDLIKKIKNRTVIKDGAMIGANAVLVAPLTINRKAVVAAGSVMTSDVEEKALGIARIRQEIKKNYVKED